MSVNRDESKKVSIVLPTYNGEKSISNALDSIINQSYKNLEIIIVNDCSTDHTDEVLIGYERKDPRIRVINNKTNQKLPKSLNIGFSKAEGDYLTWTSDDNMYKPEAIQIMVDYLNKNPNVDLVYTDISLVSMKGDYLGEVRKDTPDNLKFYNCVGACFLYRRCLKEKIGDYNPTFFLAEDYEYWIRAYLNGTLMYLPISLYYYGINPESLTATKKEQILVQSYRVKKVYFNRLFSMCKCYLDKEKFFDYMLSYLPNGEEKNKARYEFYRICFRYAITDCIRRIKRFLKNDNG